jgi:hypothetical protein
MVTATKTPGTLTLKAPAAPAAPAALVVTPSTLSEITVLARALPVVVNVKPNMVYRGARASWYTRLMAHHGKPLSELLASAAANPPSVLTARSRNAGQPERTSGWLRFFERQGVLSYRAQ